MNLRDTLQAIGEAIIAHIVFVLESGKYPLDRNTSALLKSLQVKVSQVRNAKGQFTSTPSLEVFALEYLQYLDRGRPKFTKKVPIDALLIWIRKKKIGLPGRNARGQYQPRRSRTTGRRMSATQLAFAIQMSIYKRGISGRHMLRPAYDIGQNLLEIYLDHDALDEICAPIDRFFRTAA